MALLNAKAREIEAKLVYYGTALGGKTTNLLALHRLAEPDQKQKLVSLNTAGDRTLFFDLLPFDLGRVLDWRVRLKLYTIPGQPEYNETRRVVLANTDALIFVADSDPARAAENVRSVNFFKLNCKQNRIDPETVPLVFQYNKRDLPSALPTATLEGDLNWRKAPYLVSVAVSGTGVLETFEEAVFQLTERLIGRFAPRGKATAADELRAAIRDKLQPLHARLATWGESMRVAPAASAAHVVVTRETPEGTAPRTLDTQDLLQTALENEMRLLNEMLERDRADGEAAAAPAGPAGIDPARLVQALARAANPHEADGAAGPLLEWAIAEAGASVSSGSVLLLTPGDGRLAEAARRGHDGDLLNTVGGAGMPPASRRLALAPAPVYAPELARQTLGTAMLRADLPVPQAALPLAALGSRLGLLVLYAPAGAPPIPAERRAAVEAAAAVIALALAVRALERRLRPAATPDTRPHPAPSLAAAARG